MKCFFTIFAVLLLLIGLPARAQSGTEVNSASASESKRPWRVELVSNAHVTKTVTEPIPSRSSSHEISATSIMAATKVDSGWSVGGYAIQAEASGTVSKGKKITHQVKPYFSNLLVAVDSKGNLSITPSGGGTWATCYCDLQLDSTYNIQKNAEAHTASIEYKVSAVYKKSGLQTISFMGASLSLKSEGTAEAATVLTFKAVKE